MGAVRDIQPQMAVLEMGDRTSSVKKMRAQREILSSTVSHILQDSCLSSRNMLQCYLLLY